MAKELARGGLFVGRGILINILIGRRLSDVDTVANWAWGGKP